MKAPVLMLHGEADTTFPILGANANRFLLVAKGKQSELVVYPGAERQFDHLTSLHFDAKVTADAQATTLAFLAARLK